MYNFCVTCTNQFDDSSHPLMIKRHEMTNLKNDLAFCLTFKNVKPQSYKKLGQPITWH